MDAPVACYVTQSAGHWAEHWDGLATPGTKESPYYQALRSEHKSIDFKSLPTTVKLLTLFPAVEVAPS